MSNDVIIPDDIPGGPAAIFQEQGRQYERLGEGIGMGFPIITTNGKTFVLKHGGQKYTLVNPPKDPPDEYAGLPAQYLDFVILRSGPVAHTWYKSGFGGAEDGRPDCVSADGIAPDDSSPLKQSTLCQLCPKHSWGPQANGREGRECQDSIRLAILPLPTLITAVLGVPLTEPTYLKVPAGSMKGLKLFGEQMNKRHGGNSPLCSFVTRITFNSDVSHPQFVYRLKSWLSAEQAKTILELRDDPMAYRILGQGPDGRFNTRTEAAGVNLVRLPPQERPKIDLELNAIKEPVAPALKEAAPMKAPVEEAGDDIDALIAAWRPRPPAG